MERCFYSGRNALLKENDQRKRGHPSEGASGRLSRGQLGKETAGRPQVLIRSRFHNAPGVEHVDTIGVLDRREAVGDDDPCGVEGVETAADLRLRSVVEGARRLVEK